MNPVAPLASRISCILLLVIVSALIGLRFFDRGADFPLGITSSGVLMTDEGWYANAALRHLQTGEWYRPADFNPAINMPLGQIVHRALFALFGPSLSTARLSSALSSVAVIVLIGMLVRDGFGPAAGWLTALLLASNFVAFAYSRLAILENLMLACLAGALQLSWSARTTRVAGGSLLLTAALLTKTSAVFAAPVILASAVISARDRSVRLRRGLWAIAPALVLAGAYFAYARYRYPEDYSYFFETNVSARLRHDWWQTVAEVPATLLGLRTLGDSLIAGTCLLSGLAAWRCADFRRSPMVLLLLAWLVLLVASIASMSYQPPRYFLPALVPLAAVSGIAATSLQRVAGATRMRMVPVLVVALMCVTGVVHIARAFSTREHTFTNMTADVARILRKREGAASKATVIGNMSDTVALEAGFASVNLKLASGSLEQRLQRYHPRYYLAQAELKEMRGVLEEHFVLEPLGRWDVYHNYFHHVPVQLFVLHERDGTEPVEPLPVRPSKKKKKTNA